MGKVGQGWAYGVPRMDQRVKVRMENRKVMDMKGLGNEHGTKGNRDWTSGMGLHGV